MGKHTSSKYVVTTVRSANFRPASACNAFFALSAFSYLMKILPTPADWRLPIEGRGIFMERIVPYFWHSSMTSSQISAVRVRMWWNSGEWRKGKGTFIVIIINQFLRGYHVEQLQNTAIFGIIGSRACEHGHGVDAHFESSGLCKSDTCVGDFDGVAG